MNVFRQHYTRYYLPITRFFTKMYSHLTENNRVKRKLMCVVVENVANKFCTDFKVRFLSQLFIAN